MTDLSHKRFRVVTHCSRWEIEGRKPDVGGAILRYGREKKLSSACGNSGGKKLKS